MALFSFVRCALSGLLVLSAGCAAPPAAPDGSVPDDDLGVPFADLAHADLAHADLAHPSPDAALQPGNYGHVLFLDFSGASLAWAPLNDAMHDTCSISRTMKHTVIPPFQEDLLVDSAHPTRQTLIDAITHDVAAAYAPFDVQVVSRRPPVAAYTRVVVGGRMTDADFTPTNVNAAGVATTSACDVPADQDIGIAASDDVAALFGPAGLDLAKTVAHVATHEAGHCFGLVHNDATGAFLMGPASASLAWGAGALTADSRTCGRTTQHDVAVLTNNLGLATMRDPVPPPPDDQPPTVEVLVPVAGVAIPPTATPCLSASDDSGIAFAMLQIFVKSDSQVYVLRQSSVLAPPYRFDAGGIEGDFQFRFVVVDVWGNLTERRVTGSLRNGAAAAPACP